MAFDDVMDDSITVFDVWLFHQCVKEKPETKEASVSSVEARNLRFCRSVDEEAVMAARVPRRRSKSDESEAGRENFPELILTRRGA